MTRWTTILLLLAVAACLSLAGRQNAGLRDLRQAIGISQTDPLRNAPPLVAFTTVALGGFRGMLADFLWLRASRLQQEGQYFELVQLADWITKLEPRLTSVWAYHAWNLSYNISVLFESPEDRWRWVRHGIHLLRDEGLAYNPGEPRLLYELGWIFQHKLGANLDDAHRYYKQAWAAEMALLFDGPRPDYARLERTPADRKTLLGQPGLPELVAALQQQGRDPFSPARLVDFRAMPRDPLLHTAAGRLLIDHLRLVHLATGYKLEPGIMRQLDDTYGPLDWRLPPAHTLYWAWQSRQVARDFDLLAAERMMIHALMDAVRQGSLFTGEANDLFMPSPCPDLIPRVKDVFVRTQARFPEQESFREAYKNFLAEAVITLYSYNRLPEARALFGALHETFPSEATGEEFEPFVVNVYAGNLAALAHDQARGLVEETLHQALLWQALGDAERAAGYDRLARLTWETYQASRAGIPDSMAQPGLPPLEQLRNAARTRISEERGGLR